MTTVPYYRPEPSRIHHEGFGDHGAGCAPGILAKLRPVRERDGVCRGFATGVRANSQILRAPPSADCEIAVELRSIDVSQAGFQDALQTAIACRY